MFYSYKKSISWKNTVLPIKKNLSLVLSRIMIMLRYLFIHFPLYYWSTGCLQDVKTKENFKLFAVAYRKRLSLTRGSKYNDLTWKLLVFWKTGRLCEVVATGGASVHDWVTTWFTNASVDERGWTVVHFTLNLWSVIQTICQLRPNFLVIHLLIWTPDVRDATGGCKGSGWNLNNTSFLFMEIMFASDISWSCINIFSYFYQS